MRDGPLMRWVEVEVRGEDRQALRIRRLDRDYAAALEPAGGQSDHLRQLERLNMLNNLRAEDAVERGFGQVLQVGEQVGLFGIESLLAAERDGPVREVDSLRRNAQVPHHLQELTAPASEV